ncbi:MAG: hypothetical protein KJ950_13000 [Proteobacteria bacterium]|nr:hypothetical protein [Pseudomonadota bacterium]MBU1688396.1 hypothetical protein [Pseudomonadota bacterium]
MKRYFGTVMLAWLALLLFALVAIGCGGGGGGSTSTVGSTTLSSTSSTTSTITTTTVTMTVTETYLLNLTTLGGVSHNPPAATIFTVDGSFHLSKILTYHWNGGQGDTPGTISLKNSATGEVFGPWTAKGHQTAPDLTPGSTWPTVPTGNIFLYWTALPDLDLEAGTYEVIDSNPTTWSYNSDTQNMGIAFVYGWETTGGTHYTQGDLVGQDVFFEELSGSISKTSGALLQAILAVNSVLYTDNTITDIGTFDQREIEADQALTTLETYADEAETLIGQNITSSLRSYQSVRAGSLSSEEVLATVAGSSSTHQLKTLMTTYKVNAKQAKEILDNAMAGLKSTYDREADFNNNAMNAAKVIRDGAGLAITVVGGVVSAGGVTGALGVIEATATVITGVDGVIKVTQSGMELIVGRDIPQSSGTIGAIFTGISDASEIIGLTSLRKWAEAPDAISNIISITMKTSDALQDKQLNLGAHTFDLTASNPSTVTEAKGISTIPTTLPGTYKINGTTVEVIELPKDVTDVIDRLPDTDKVDGLTADDTSGGSTTTTSVSGTWTEGGSSSLMNEYTFSDGSGVWIHGGFTEADSMNTSFTYRVENDIIYLSGGIIIYDLGDCTPYQVMISGSSMTWVSTSCSSKEYIFTKQ